MGDVLVEEERQVTALCGQMQGRFTAMHAAITAALTHMEEAVAALPTEHTPPTHKWRCAVHAYRVQGDMILHRCARHMNTPGTARVTRRAHAMKLHNLMDCATRFGYLVVDMTHLHHMVQQTCNPGPAAAAHGVSGVQ